MYVDGSAPAGVIFCHSPTWPSESQGKIFTGALPPPLAAPPCPTLLPPAPPWPPLPTGEVPAVPVEPLAPPPVPALPIAAVPPEPPPDPDDELVPAAPAWAPFSIEEGSVLPSPSPALQAAANPSKITKPTPTGSRTERIWIMADLSVLAADAAQAFLARPA
jgi:hypothetical protein